MSNRNIETDIDNESGTFSNFKVIKAAKKHQKEKTQQQKQNQSKQSYKLLDNLTPNYVLGYN